MKVILCFATLNLFFIFLSCQKDEPENGRESDIPKFVLAGGETTIFDATSNAYATPAPNLNPTNLEKHLEGDLAFEQIFVTPPAIVNPGLGPLFNNNSCVSCHIRNGRAEPAANGDKLSGFLIRLSIPGLNEVGGPKAVPFFGTQLQNRAVFGLEREASFSIDNIELIVEFIDGTVKPLIKPKYSITQAYQILPDDLMFSPRVAPAVFGLGLLEAIPESDLLAIEDESDSNGDGISGKPNWVWNIEEQTLTLGRFGWKAENPSARQQTADAYHQDIGITSSLFPQESCFQQPNCKEDDGLVDIDDQRLDATTFYIQSLAVPAVRNLRDPEVLRGRDLFEQVECHTCHVPQHRTGMAAIPELSDQTIFPYTDLLLHDMGEGLADNRPSFRANGNEWRTPPLWGIGLLPVVNGHSRLMHDGRARNIEEAILWHAGEAEGSKQSYIRLSENDRNALIAFVSAL